MNPPPLPDDETPPPLPPPPPAGSVPPARDPLLDDPMFAEIVGPSGDAPGPAPLYAEPVGDAPDDLPVAEPVEPPAPPPLPRAQPVRAAEPVPPFAPRSRPQPTPDPRPTPPPASAPARRPPPTPATDNTLPKSRWLSACAVIGCLGVAVLGAVAFLAFVAVTILAQLGDRVSERDRDRAPGQGAAASARPGPIARDQFRNRTGKVDFPGACDAVCRGAGGRYLFFHIPSQKSVAVFDANTGEIVRSIPDVAPNARIAAGAAKLFVYTPDPAKRTVARYDLTTWEQDATVTLSRDVGGVDALAVGPGSDGPVYLVGTASGNRVCEIRVYDGGTLHATRLHRLPDWEAGTVRHARASDDGTVLGLSGDTGAVVLRVSGEGETVETVPVFGGPPRVTPSPDGEFLFTPRGVFTADGKAHTLTTRNGYTVPPAHGGGLFLRLPVGANGLLAAGPPDLYLDAPAAEVGVLRGVTLPGGLPVTDTRVRIPADQRVYLWPAAGLAAVLPVSNDRLDLVRVDVAEVLRQSAAADYVVIGSDPPRTAVRGKEWKYVPEVWARNPARARLSVTGPKAKGMRVAAGVVTWTPDEAGAVDVAVSAGDPDQPASATQKFRVVVIEPEE